MADRTTCVQHSQEFGSTVEHHRPRILTQTFAGVCCWAALQDLPQKLAAEPRTPPRSAVASAAAAGSTAGPGSPRSGPSATKSPLVHGRTATGPGSSSRRAADAAAGTADEAEDADTPGFGQGLIAAAACFLLRQAPPEMSSAASAAAGAASGPLAAADGQILVDPVSLNDTLMPSAARIAMVLGDACLCARCSKLPALLRSQGLLVETVWLTKHVCHSHHAALTLLPLLPLMLCLLALLLPLPLLLRSLRCPSAPSA
jgi:hypothetical protein